MLVTDHGNALDDMHFSYLDHVSLQPPPPNGLRGPKELSSAFAGGRMSRKVSRFGNWEERVRGYFLRKGTDTAMGKAFGATVNGVWRTGH